MLGHGILGAVIITKTTILIRKESQLQKQLQNWMTDAKVQVKDRTKVRALIGPYDYFIPINNTI